MKKSIKFFCVSKKIYKNSNKLKQIFESKKSTKILNEFQKAYKGNSPKKSTKNPYDLNKISFLNKKNQLYLS